MSEADAGRDGLTRSVELVLPELERARQEVAHLEQRKAALEVDLSLAALRVEQLAATVALLRELTGGSQSVDSAPTTNEATGRRFVEELLTTSGHKKLVSVEPPQRVRSTDAVVEVVTHADHPLTRDEVVRALEERGETASMKNPRNAVNTALYRAALKQGRIRKLDNDTYAPLDSDSTQTSDQLQLAGSNDYEAGTDA